MDGNSVSLLALSLGVTLVLLVLAFIGAMIRALLGPTLPDRVVALDLVTTILMGVIAVFLIRDEQPVFLDAVGVLALVSFLGTVAYARYLEKDKSHD